MTTTTKSATAAARAVPGPNADTLLRMYRQMLAIRLFEERVNDLYTRALMPGLAHLYIGEEAVAVGICEALRQDDYITSTHRGHGHCLAKGADPRLMFAELLGKEKVGDRALQGVDILKFGADDRIAEMTVMVRPMSGVHALAEAMKRMLVRFGPLSDFILCPGNELVAD